MIKGSKRRTVRPRCKRVVLVLDRTGRLLVAACEGCRYPRLEVGDDVCPACGVELSGTTTHAK